MIFDVERLLADTRNDGDIEPAPATVMLCESLVRDVHTICRPYVSSTDGGIRIEWWIGEKKTAKCVVLALPRIALGAMGYVYQSYPSTRYTPARRERLFHCLFRSGMLVLPE